MYLLNKIFFYKNQRLEEMLRNYESNILTKELKYMENILFQLFDLVKIVILSSTCIYI